MVKGVVSTDGGKLCEEGITAHKARQLLGIALHMASYEESRSRPFTHTRTHCITRL